ncbi:hypothetical protein DPQ22_04575 [Candidatus Tokpelaia sp.]|nr:hypothetical protein DPQ22_04575 [Candidatus Tokpelaia sp.]
MDRLACGGGRSKEQARVSRANSARVGGLWAQQRTGARKPCKMRSRRNWSGTLQGADFIIANQEL